MPAGATRATSTHRNQYTAGVRTVAPAATSRSDVQQAVTRPDADDLTGFAPDERRALDDNAVPVGDWATLRTVLRRVTDDTARLWMTLRRKMPLEMVRTANSHGFITLDELFFLAQFPDGEPRFDQESDGWLQARRLRDGARLDVGWIGVGDNTVDARGVDYAVVDFETTGLNPYTDRVIEVAVIRVDGTGRELLRWSTLIDPQQPVTHTDVHGITADMLQAAPVWDQIAPVLRRHLDGAVLVAHNATFEEHFLAAETSRTGQRLGSIAALDTKRLAGQTWDGLPSRSLTAVCDHLGIVNQHPHRAMGDTEATAAVLARTLDVLDRDESPTFGFRIPAPTTGLTVT